MDSDRVLPEHTVLVEGDQITAVGPDVPLPEGTRVIDGRGRWLMPGLVDFHTHERPLPSWPDDVAGNLVMDLANGITTIANMGDFTGDMIGVRAQVRDGQLAGPSVLVGYFVRGVSDGGTTVTTVRDEATARTLVQRAASQGYDFLKVYDGVPASAFDTVLAEGQARGLPVVGHTVASVGLPQAVQRGQVMLAHALSLQGPGGPLTDLLLSRSVAVTATLHVTDLIGEFGLDALAGRDLFARVLAQDGIEFMDDRAFDAWRAMLQQRADIRAPADRRASFAALQAVVKASDDAGVPVLLGSDEIGIPGVVPGFSIHAELRLLREAGLTPWRALATGTRNAHTFVTQHLPATPRFGLVEVGGRADLLLLDEDPRQGFATLRRPLGVMAAGRWYPTEWLQAELGRLRAR